MKTIKELSELEISALTDEQLEILVKQAKLENGIKFMDCPEAPIYEAIEEPQINTYKINGIYEFVLTDENEARELSEMLSKLKSLSRTDYTSNSDYRYVNTYEKRKSIEVSTAYDIETYKSVKDKLQKNSNLKKEYELKLKEYHANEELSKDIIDEIYTIYRDITRKYYELSKHISRFKNDYVTLAENDVNKAMLFYDKAYKLNDFEKQYILENL
jgi:hypothetical protein